MKGDIWILVPHLGHKTNILGFRIRGFRVWVNFRSWNKMDLDFEIIFDLAVKVYVRRYNWILGSHMDFF